MSGIPSKGSGDPKATPSKVWGDGVGVKTLEPSTAIQRGPSASWGPWKGFGSKPHLPSLSAQPGSALSLAGSTRRRLATGENSGSVHQNSGLWRRPRAVQPAPGDEATSTAPETRRRGPWPLGSQAGVGCAGPKVGCRRLLLPEGATGGRRWSVGVLCWCAGKGGRPGAVGRGSLCPLLGTLLAGALAARARARPPRRDLRSDVATR